MLQLNCLFERCTFRRGVSNRCSWLNQQKKREEIARKQQSTTYAKNTRISERVCDPEDDEIESIQSLDLQDLEIMSCEGDGGDDANKVKERQIGKGSRNPKLKGFPTGKIISRLDVIDDDVENSWLDGDNFSINDNSVSDDS